MPHVQVLWPDGSPTGRLLRLEDARLVTEAAGGNGRSERMFALGGGEATIWITVRRDSDAAPIGEAERDDQLDPGLIATMLIVPQAVAWYSSRKLPHPAELCAQAARFDSSWRQFRARPELGQLLERLTSATAAEVTDAPSSKDLQVLRDLGLVTTCRVGEDSFYRSIGFVRSGNVPTVVAWIEAKTKPMRKSGLGSTSAPTKPKRLSKMELALRLRYALDEIRKDPSTTNAMLSKTYEIPLNTLKKNEEVRKCRREAKARLRRRAPDRALKHLDPKSEEDEKEED